MNHKHNVTLSDLEDWITQYKADLTPDGPVTDFTLCHTVNGQEIETLCKVGRVDEKESETIAGELWSTAENDADSKLSGTPQRYVIYAYRDSDEPTAQIAFIRTSRSPLAMRGSNTEAPNEKGLLAQMMRQNEEMHKFVMTISEASAGRMARDLENERKRREVLESNQFKVYEQYQNLLDKTFERDLKREDAKASQVRSEQIMGIIMAIAPGILTKFLGNSALPPNLPALGAPSGGRDAAIGAFLESLKGEEIQGILSSLEPEKRDILMKLYAEYRSAKGSENINESEEIEESEKSEH